MAEQGQSSGGAAGTPIMGAVTTAAPTYVTATFGFLSIDTGGALRVSGTVTATEAAVGATGAAVPASANYIGINIAGTLTGVLGGHGTAAGALRVELPTDGTGVVGLNAGTAVIGKVSIDQTTPGTTNLVALAANQSVNVAQINAVTPLMGNGATGTGSPRVTIASDSSGIITTGTAGSASATVLTVQGVASMTAVQVSPVAATAGGYSFLHIAAGQATTTVKSGAGTLHSIVLNSAATATNTTTIYDNTAASGTIIAIPAVTTATVPTTLIFDIAFTTGLTIITAAANGGDMTICYK